MNGHKQTMRQNFCFQLILILLKVMTLMVRLSTQTHTESTDQSSGQIMVWCGILKHCVIGHFGQYCHAVSPE